MQSLFDFIIKPKNERYDNKKYIDLEKNIDYTKFKINDLRKLVSSLGVSKEELKKMKKHGLIERLKK